ncbi:MAG: UvrD-helicase domain-containing protein [Sulfuricaulis sp.]
MRAAGVRLLTNVLCVRKGDGKLLGEAEIARRLSYFQLLELSRRNPRLFSPTLHYESPTPLQAAQRDAFLRPGMLSLWTLHPEFRPIDGKAEPNPFVEDDNAGGHTSGVGTRTIEPPAGVEEKAAESAGPAPADKPEDSQGEQERVVKAHGGEDMFVIAPPGTGKTHVLVDRLAFLVTEGLVQNPVEEILVLSFTRSAVAEVRRRLVQKRDNGGHPDIVYPKVMTFDSFATQCLVMDLERDALAGRGFAERIQLFNRLLDKNLPRASEMLKAVKFLLVDEVQDLTGDRAKMVLNIARIVKQSGGAVCFLGDPAQAIYDFDEEQYASMSSQDFLKTVMSGGYGAAPPFRHEFRHYRRFESPKMREFVARASAAMGPDGLQPDGGRIEELVRGLGEPVELSSLPDTLGRSGSTAILTRTNLEAYQVWKICESMGLKADLWRGSSGNYWPGWIARLTLGYGQDSMSLEMARKRWKDHIGPLVRISFTEAIAFLMTQGVVADDRIDLVQLNRVVASSAPIAKKPERQLGLVISTIHRSKGLEFDDVRIYQPKDNFAGRSDEVRVIYVAATRARKDLGIIRADRSIKWGARNNYQKGLRTHHFNIVPYPKYPSVGLLVDGPDEADWTSEIRAPDAGAQEEVAKKLWLLGGAGAPQNAVIERAVATGRLIITVGGIPICEPNLKLVDDLQTVASWQGKHFISMRDIHLVDLASHAYEITSATTQQAFGAACLGLSPVLSGIGVVITG